MVDPLEEHFAKHPELVSVRDGRARYIEGVGERLPAASRAYDLVIIDNCIDHGKDPKAVLAEIRRVLRVNGVLYLSVNTRSRVGYWIHRALSRSLLDPGHPYTFTALRLRSLVETAGFETVEFTEDSYWGAVTDDLKSGRPPAIVKALLGISEFAVRIVARRVSDPAEGDVQDRQTTGK
jgi:SAM-dependent methyltransferase